ncbi:MAG: tyrosine--tRNA ligase [Candidatus Omnitrophica bacterium]|nr:tyrosine--tRNA ligase [Candidatus Omnitrophota bacterium]
MNIDKQIEIFAEGCIDVITAEDLKKKLVRAQKEKRPLAIKYGADPSTADIHLGHTVPLRKLRTLQELGHHVYFLIGDFTAIIGDPTGRSETRNILTTDEIQENARTYQKQVFKILDRSKTTVVYNSKWLSTLSSYDFLMLTSKYTVARILERDDFKNRFENDKPIAIIEFLYPLLQGYDSVVLKNDIEIGGTDQKFNLLVGRALQRDYGLEGQVILTLPLIEGTDGVKKMSKTFGNSINLTDTSTNMFGKIMSLPDDLIIRYYTYVTSISSKECADIEQKLKSGTVNPRDVKIELAKEIVSFYYKQEEAMRAMDEFNRIFRAKGIPDDIMCYELKENKKSLVDLLSEYDLSKSKSDARRIITQGGVKIDGQKNTDINSVIDIKKEVLIQCGKRKFAKFTYKT